MCMCRVGLRYKFFFSYKNSSYMLHIILQFALYTYLYIMYFSGHNLIPFKSSMAFSFVLMYQNLSRFLFIDILVVF